MFYPQWNGDTDKTFLPYEDVTLTHADVDTVGNDWLTDNVIGFWEAYLENTVTCRPEYKSAHIKLLRPSISYTLTQENDPRLFQSLLPALNDYSHVFLPINDNPDPSRAGGTHWSLLLVSLLDQTAFHYDSAGRHNMRPARTATHQLGRFLGYELEFRHLDDSPRQSNGVDCGAFVCAEMEYLLVRRLLRHYKRDRVNMSLGNKNIPPRRTRSEIHNAIMEEKQRHDKQKSQ